MLLSSIICFFAPNTNHTNFRQNHKSDFTSYFLMISSVLRSTLTKNSFRMATRCFSSYSPEDGNSSSLFERVMCRYCRSRMASTKTWKSESVWCNSPSWPKTKCSKGVLRSISFLFYIMCRKEFPVLSSSISMPFPILSLSFLICSQLPLFSSNALRTWVLTTTKRLFCIAMSIFLSVNNS